MNRLEIIKSGVIWFAVFLLAASAEGWATLILG